MEYARRQSRAEEEEGSVTPARRWMLTDTPGSF
jgi:hypothetical protein